MRHLALAAIAAIGAVACAGAAAAETELMAPVHQFIDSFNKGDAKGVAASHVAGAVAILDEAPPHIWSGPRALQAWTASLAAEDKAKGNSDQAVTLGAPQREAIDGASGYVVVPAVYTYKQKGVAMREPATMTFALTKTAKGWRISGWSWNGTEPAPAN